MTSRICLYTLCWMIIATKLMKLGYV